VTCPPPSGGYIDVSFTFSQGSTVYAITLPAPFDVGDWAVMTAGSSMTCKGPYDGTSWVADCSSTGNASYFGNAVFSGSITTSITGIVQCAQFNVYGGLVGTGVPCGSGGGGGAPGTPYGSIQYNNYGVFAGFTAGGDLTFSAPNFTLNTVNSSPVSCGSSTQSCVLTINGKGLVTSSSTATISGGGGGGNPFSGSVTANTSLTDGAGFFINSVGVIQWSGALSAVDIGNVFNISASGDIITCTRSGTSPYPCVSYPHHVDAGSYYLAGTQVIDGSANAYLGTVNGSSGIFTGSVTANYTPTNYAGYYMHFPATNSPGGYTGDTGIIQYATGSPAVVNIGHVQDITAGGTIFTTGHIAVTPATDIVALAVTGATGGHADLLTLYNQTGGTPEFSVTHVGLVDQYGGVFTEGMGVAPIYYSDSFLGLTSSTGTQNLQCNGGVCAAGTYRVHIYIHCSSSGSLSTTLSWNDGAAETQGFGGPASNGFEYLTQEVYTTGSYNISFSTVVTGSVTYNLYVTLERLQ
jgi:hypothetical protein